MARQNNILFIDIPTNLEELTGGVYDHALLRLRSALEETCVNSGGNRRPVLTVYTNNNNNIRWFDIHFHRNRSTRVTARFRRDDLYLYGYHVTDQRWREFHRDDGLHLVDQNSRYLAFDGSYGDLEREGGDLTQLTLGREALIDAVDTLITSTNDGQIARALAVIIMMFAEAARFHPIQNFVQTVFFPNPYGPARNMAGWMIDLVHMWGDLSGYILYYIQNPNEQWVAQTIVILGPGPHYDPITVVARTIGQMLYYMGILQNSPGNIRPAPPN